MLSTTLSTKIAPSPSPLPTLRLLMLTLALPGAWSATSSAQTPNSRPPSPTLEEIGLLNSGLYNPTVGAFRGWGLTHGHYRFWTGDNALVLWALSKNHYQFGRQTWAGPLRDYLVDCSFNTGLFTEGSKQDPHTGAISRTPNSCSPAMETQVLQGIIAFTAEYPHFPGRRTLAQYSQFIDTALRDQNRRILANQAGLPCDAGPGTNHDFTAPATIAFHLMGCSRWARFTGKEAYRDLARRAWPRLRAQRRPDGAFQGSLRDAQILLALVTISDEGLRLDGIADVINGLRRAARKSGDGALTFGPPNNATTDTQALAYHLMSFDERTFTADSFLRNRLCRGPGLGYLWRGHYGVSFPGPVEDQAMALLGVHHMRQRGWSEPGPPPFTSFALQIATAHPAPAPHLQTIVADWDADGFQDLYIVAYNAALQTYQVHVLSGASGYQTYVVHALTQLATAPGERVVFDAADFNLDRRADLYAVYPGRATTEVHILDAATHFQSFLSHAATPLGSYAANADFVAGDYDRDGRSDVYLVLKSSTGSGKTEVHVLSAAQNFAAFSLHAASALPETGPHVRFAAGDYNRDGCSDLYAIFPSGTASGNTEVHILDGAAAFTRFSAHSATVLQSVDASVAFSATDTDRDGVDDVVSIFRGPTGSGKLEIHSLAGGAGACAP